MMQTLHATVLARLGQLLQLVFQLVGIILRPIVPAHWLQTPPRSPSSAAAGGATSHSHGHRTASLLSSLTTAVSASSPLSPSSSSSPSPPPTAPRSPHGLKSRSQRSTLSSTSPSNSRSATAGIERRLSSAGSIAGHQPIPRNPSSSHHRSSHHPALRKKTLVLDLDETLIHSTTRGTLGRSDHLVEVTIDHHVCLYHVYKRPHVDFFLRKVAEWYKVVIFTASLQEYADPVIDLLDMHQGIVDRRYFRQSCVQHGGTYLKDLTVIEPDLSQVCLLDNSPASYAINQANGIPIEGWVNDLADEALLELLPFLDALRFTEDVRSVLGLRLYTPT